MELNIYNYYPERTMESFESKAEREIQAIKVKIGFIVFIISWWTFELTCLLHQNERDVG